MIIRRGIIQKGHNSLLLWQKGDPPPSYILNVIKSLYFFDNHRDHIYSDRFVAEFEAEKFSIEVLLNFVAEKITFAAGKTEFCNKTNLFIIKKIKFCRKKKHFCSK